MSDLYQAEDISPENQRLLAGLAWEIAASQGEFKLIFARYNYIDLRSPLIHRLQEISSVEIRLLVLQPSERNLYATIQQALAEGEINALMVVGLESLVDLDLVLTATNQVRDSFRKNCLFPMIFWITDQVLIKLMRLAPDFESWGTTTQLAIAPANLTTLLQAKADLLFSHNLHLSLADCWQLQAELAAAQKDLLNYPQTNPETKANLASLLGFTHQETNQIDAAIGYYQQGREFWQQQGNLVKEEKLLVYLAYCDYIKAFKQKDRSHPDWQATQNHLQAYLNFFTQNQRADLVAQSLPILGKILRSLADWDNLQKLVETALPIHKNEKQSIALAQDYGFLAEVALAKANWNEAKGFAEKALKVFETISEVPADESQSRYLLALARSQQNLNQYFQAIANLEVAKQVGNPEYDPQLYLDILRDLQQLYFNFQKDYIKAFEIKQYQRSIEQQYGFRAFIGAGRIQPQRQTKLTLLETASQDAIAPEIAASGRQQDVERLIERIGRNDYKLIVIHGKSGVGKSSLLNAGLMPALKHKSIGIQDVLSVVIRVYTNWVAELGRLLTEKLAEKGIVLDAPLNSVAEILSELQQSEVRNLRVVVILDQFEEFFFVCEHPAARREFFEFLGECLRNLAVKVVLSLREDYLPFLLECNRLSSMAIIGNDILSRNVLYELGDFSGKDTQEIIQKLIERSHTNLQPELITELVQDLAGELDSVRPIELQIVGAQLETEKIKTLAQYRQSGLKTELVKRYLAEVVADCGTENQQLANLVLYLLTDERGTRPLKTRFQLEQDLELLPTNPEATQLDLVLKIFVDSGLVVLLPENPADRYQLVHDYLAAFIRQQQEPKLKQVQLELAREKEQRLKAEVERQRTEEQLKQSEESRQILAAAHTEAQRIIAVAQEGARLEREGVNALKQFEFEQIAALLTAMHAGQDLKKLVQDGCPLEEYPAASPLLALQTILDGIREKTQLKGHQRSVKSASFSPDGQRIVTASYDKTARVWDLSGKLLAELQGHQDSVWSASFSPDGQRIVTASYDKTARVWDLSGKLLAELKGHQDSVWSASFSPDGQRIVTASYDKTARVWDLSGKLLAELQGHQEGVNSASFSPDGQRIVTASYDKTARVWDLSGKLLAELQGHQREVNSASFSPDGQRIVTASYDKTARVWDLSGKLLAELQGHQEGVNSASFSPDGQRIVTASNDNTARVWDLSGKLLAELQGHQDFVISASFSPDGQRIVTASNDNTARVWDLSGKLLTELKGHQNFVESASFSPDGQRIVTASADNTAGVWDLSGKLLSELKGHQYSVWSASFSPDGQRIVTASGDKTARVWDFSGKWLAELHGHQDSVWSASFSPDGQRIVTASYDKTARVWDFSGKLLSELKGHQDSVWSASFSPDGQRIVTASGDKTARVWDLSGKLLSELNGHQNFVWSASFSPDGQRIVTASKDKTARVWDLSGKLLTELKGHQNFVESASFSRDGQQIVTASGDKTARVWDLSGKLLAELKGHQYSVYNASFSHDGQRIVTASSDKTARVWDLSGKLLAELKGHQGFVNSASFSPDGQRIVTASRDKTARVWDLSGKLLAELKGHQGFVNSASFSPDGQRIVTASLDKTARVWWVDKNLDQLLERGCNWLHDYLQTDVPARDKQLCPP